MKKILYIVFGWISLSLGITGIVIPGLPTTPFLLLSAWLFARSSKRFHFWLVNHKIFGKIINNYQKHGGVSMRVKLGAIAFMCCGGALSYLQFGISKPGIIILVAILTGCLILLFIVPQAKNISHEQ